MKIKTEGDHEFCIFTNCFGDIEVLILDYVLLQPKEMVGFLLLLNQIICKFNTLFNDILEEVFPTIAGRIFNVIPRDAFPSGPGTNTEVWEDQYSNFIYFFIFVLVLYVTNASVTSTHDLDIKPYDMIIID